jgi:hypothetical protein
MYFGRRSNISADPIKHALNQKIGETIVCPMIDSNISTTIIKEEK